MKLFGRELFKARETKLYDFARHGITGDHDDDGLMGFVAVRGEAEVATPKKKRGRPAVKPKEYTPKEVYQAESLNDNNFQINIDMEYIEKQIADADKRLDLLPKSRKNRGEMMFGPQGYAIEEIESLKERLRNRKRISEFKAIVDKYPHTTSAKISDVVTEHKNLRCRDADQFVPDFPIEAIEAMKEYNEMCQKLCGKDTNFYVIADRKDFGEVARRRDPILLAQSPFGIFWQILGAWDDEMIYLGDL